MLHWIEGEDRHGMAVWLRYVECGHWGLVLTHVLPRWINCHAWERGIAQIKPSA